jgi:hypothetical protein
MQHHCQRLSRAAMMGDAEAVCKSIAVIKLQECFISRDTPLV